MSDIRFNEQKLGMLTGPTGNILDRFIVFPREDSAIAERGADHPDIATITFRAQFSNIFDSYAADPDNAAEMVEAFLEAMPQEVAVDREAFRHPPLMEELSAFLAVQQLQQLRTELEERLEMEQEIDSGADEFRGRAGAGTDVSAAKDDDPATRDARDAFRRQQLSDILRDGRVAANEQSFGDLPDNAEIEEMARGDDPGEWSSLTPGECFQVAKLRLISGITGNARSRIHTLEVDLIEGGVVAQGEVDQLITDITHLSRQMHYKGNDGRQDQGMR